MSVDLPQLRRLIAALAVGGLLAAAPGQVQEVEPNSTKAEATPATLNGFGLPPTNQISGLSTGMLATAGSADPASVDTWRLRTAPAPLGIYRHQLSISTSGVAGHAVSLRGLSQIGGVISANDASAQTGSSSTAPPRTVAWYGFGKQEEVFCRVAGTSTTTAAYVGTLTSTPVSPVTTTALLFAGNIDIRVAAVGAFLIDSDIWLYDADLNAIAGAGNDDEFGSPNATSRLVRSLGPGTYTLAVGRFNLANNLPSPSDDDFRSGVVLDLPNALVNSQVNPSGSTFTGVANVVLSDGVSAPVTIPLTFAPGTIGDIQFLRFTVYPVGTPTGACCTGTGACTLVAGVPNCPSGSVYLGDQSACTPANPCPLPGACCAPDSCCWIAQSADCIGQWQGPGSTCSVLACATPANDLCQNAQPISINEQTSGANCAATSSGDGPDATCSTSSALGVWFAFIPPATASYRISTCGSNQDSVLQVFASDDCQTFTPVACDEDSCDGVTPPGSGLAANIASVVLPAGQRVLVRVSTFGSTPSGARFTLLISANSGLGACCQSSGGCLLSDVANCPGIFVPGGACVPSPCVQPAGQCCRGAICSIVDPASCVGTSNGGAVFNASDSSCLSPTGIALCCLPDYDKLGGITINDIFAFLNDWFAGSPLANFGTDGSLPPQDVTSIFSFLNAWFLGGC